MDDYNNYLAGLMSAIVAVMVINYLLEPPPQAPPRRPRRVWARQWLLRKEIFGDYDNLLVELHREDSRR